MKRKRKQGIFNQYTSMDTQILGMVIAGATNKKLEDYFQEKLWSKIGAEQDAYFLTDKVGFPIAYGGLMTTTRDLAKIGMLMLNDGKNYKQEQIISPDWIKQSTTTDKVHLLEGKNNPNSDYPEGYKNKWWFPIDRDNGDYAAIGIYGQTLYINPDKNILIASSCAYPEYTADYYHADSRRLKMFQVMANHINQ